MPPKCRGVVLLYRKWCVCFDKAFQGQCFWQYNLQQPYNLDQNWDGCGTEIKTADQQTLYLKSQRKRRLRLLSLFHCWQYWFVLVLILFFCWCRSATMTVKLPVFCVWMAAVTVLWVSVPQFYFIFTFVFWDYWLLKKKYKYYLLRTTD